jgi:hypothetical protein
MDSDLKRRVAEAAAADDRDFTSLVSTILKAWLEGERYKPGNEFKRKPDREPKAVRSGVPADLRPMPGRPRKFDPSVDLRGFIEPVTRATADRERVTVDEVKREGQLKDLPHTAPMIEVCLLSLGFKPFLNATDDTVWAKPPGDAQSD